MFRGQNCSVSGFDVTAASANCSAVRCLVGYSSQSHTEGRHSIRLPGRRFAFVEMMKRDVRGREKCGHGQVQWGVFVIHDCTRRAATDNDVMDVSPPTTHLPCDPIPPSAECTFQWAPLVGH